jgi:hypothetical protein
MSPRDRRAILIERVLVAAFVAVIFLIAAGASYEPW